MIRKTLGSLLLALEFVALRCPCYKCVSVLDLSDMDFFSLSRFPHHFPEELQENPSYQSAAVSALHSRREQVTHQHTQYSIQLSS